MFAYIFFQNYWEIFGWGGGGGYNVCGVTGFLRTF